MKIAHLEHELRTVQHKNGTPLAVFRKAVSDVKGIKSITGGE